MDPGVQGRESFVPSLEFVTNITNDLNAVVTVFSDTDYSVGQLISFRVSRPFGMYEINNKTGTILAINGDNLTVNINTLQFTPFIYPVSGKNTPPIVVPAGSGIVPDVNPPMTNLLDVFDCVRPS